MAKQPLTTRQVAEQLSISTRRVQALIASGRLKARRIDRDWLIDPADLDAVRDRPQGWPKGRPRGGKKNPKKIRKKD